MVIISARLQSAMIPRTVLHGAYQQTYLGSHQEAWRNGKVLEICIESLEFESKCTPLVKACDSRGFTRSLKPTKCVSGG